MTKNRGFRVATEVVGAALAVRGLVSELRKGRRMHAGKAALKVAAAVVGAVIAIRAIDEVEDDT